MGWSVETKEDEEANIFDSSETEIYLYIYLYTQTHIYIYVYIIDLYVSIYTYIHLLTLRRDNPTSHSSRCVPCFQIVYQIFLMALCSY